MMVLRMQSTFFCFALHIITIDEIFSLEFQKYYDPLFKSVPFLTNFYCNFYCMVIKTFLVILINMYSNLLWSSFTKLVVLTNQLLYVFHSHNPPSFRFSAGLFYFGRLGTLGKISSNLSLYLSSYRCISILTAQS